MARYAVVISTSAWDPFVEKQIERTKAHVATGDLFVLANETSSLVPVSHRFSKLSISEDDVDFLGLLPLFEETLFCYNLDYLYAIFHENYPNYEYYVFLDFAASIETDIDRLIARAAEDGLDMLAEPIGEPLDTWVYAKVHHAMYPPGILEGVSLPIIILSKAALVHLVARRQALSRQYDDGPPFFWPFCEAFVPTELKLAGFRSAPLSRYGSVERFTWWPPILDAMLEPIRQPGFIHPVLDRRRYILALLKHTPSRDLLRHHLYSEGLSGIRLRDYFWPLASEAKRRIVRIVAQSWQRSATHEIRIVTRKR